MNINGTVALLIMLVAGVLLHSGCMLKSEETPTTVGVLTGGFSGAKPSIAIDANNNIHIVAANSRPESNGVHYKKLDNKGNPLTGDMRITNGTSNSPVIVVDADSNAHIAWQGEVDGMWGIYYVQLNSNGGYRTGVVRVAATTGVLEPPSLAVDQLGSVYIAWQNAANREVRYKRLDGEGNALTGEVRIGNAQGRSSERPSIATDSDNNVHIVWGDNDVIYYKKLDTKGNNLTGAIRISQGFSAVSSSIAVDSNHNIHIAWQDDRRPKKWDIYYKKLDNGGNDLTGDIELYQAKRYCMHPSIAVDSGNNVHIAWSDDRNEEEFKPGGINYEIYYKRLDSNGKDLTGDFRVTNSKPGSLSPSIAVDSGNNVHLVWHDCKDEKSEDWRDCGIYYARLDSSGPK